MTPWTTLAELKEARACLPGYRRLCKALGGVRSYGKDTPIPLLKILETNGLDDVIWALKTVLSLRPMYNEYSAKLKIINADYWAKRKPIHDEYLARLTPIEGDRQAKCNALLVSILSEEAK